jgi:hypothetical protein
MPFNADTLFPFERDLILRMPPMRGIYGIWSKTLSHPGRMIYVGESENVQRRLLEHLSLGDNTPLRLAYPLFPPTHFVVEGSQGGIAHAIRELELIFEYDPPCNKYGRSALGLAGALAMGRPTLPQLTAWGALSPFL